MNLFFTFYMAAIVYDGANPLPALPRHSYIIYIFYIFHLLLYFRRCQNKMSHEFSDREKYFNCFSPRILQHLLANGFETIKDKRTNYTGQYLHVRTLKWCHVFEKTPELCICLAEVSNINK